MYNFLSYDIEIYSELKDENDVERDLKDIIPSVAAYCLDDLCPKYFYDDPYMSKETSQELVLQMWDCYEKGIVPLTWNGLSFDFKLLALYSGMIKECAVLALNHVDMMFEFTCRKGYFLGLNTALLGMGIEQKLHEVNLNNGEKFSEMSGREAPRLWREKEFNAVKDYLALDVIQPMKLANRIYDMGQLNWVSKTGNQQSVFMNLSTVKQCFKFRIPDTSWMKVPPKSRMDFADWIPVNILEEEGII
jgi:hypothetical protein